MRILEITEHVARVVDTEPHKGIWFRHESPHWITRLRPLTYEELKVARPEYDVPERVKTEKQYHAMLPTHPENTSFLYATVTGCHKMPDPLDYLGFTYYFKLTPDQVEQSIFDVVDRKTWMQPTVGAAGFRQAKEIWDAHSNEFKSYDDPEIGQIDPRIEVIMPFSVSPLLYIPQIEDRQSPK
jgi:hypothetical protein